jgi:RNA polymerase primary sigma factor
MKNSTTSLTKKFSDVDSVDYYLSRIGTIKPLTADEEKILSEKIRNGDKKARNKLIKANLRFVVSVARNYLNQGMPLSDLINEGNYGLIKASEKFDEQKNFKFISYAVWWIRQSILKALAEQSRMVKIPLHVVSNISDITKAQGIIEQKSHRVVTSQDLALKLEKIPETEIQRLLMVGNRHVSLDQFIGEGDLRLIDTLIDEEESNTEERILNAMDTKQIKTALKSLKHNEGEVLRLYFGIDQANGYSATLEEIGNKLNLTRERVRQIKERALKNLKQYKKLESLKSRI